MGRHSEDVMRLCVEAWLRDVRDKREAVSMAMERVKMAEGSASGLRSPSASCGGSGFAADQTADNVAALVDAKDSLASMLANEQAEVDTAFGICRKRIGGRALWMHYVLRKPWADVAAGLGYSRSRITEIAASYIPKLYRDIPEAWRRYSIPNALPGAGGDIDPPSRIKSPD